MDKHTTICTFLVTALVAIAMAAGITAFGQTTANSQSTASSQSTSSLSTSGSNATLGVQVNGARNNTGQICVHIYNNAKSFPKIDRSLHHRCKKVTTGKVYLEFENLAKGEYGAFAFHDEDENNTILSNWVGMPKEGVGASRNAKGFMGPPKFRKAKIKLNAPKKTIQITLKYL